MYYGVYYSSKLGKWAWREADYKSDVEALDKMQRLALEYTTIVEKKPTKKMAHYQLELLKQGNRVIFNG